MNLTASPSSKNQQSRLGGLITKVRDIWEQAQTRLGSMVLTDVPIVLSVAAFVLSIFGVMMVLSASSVEQISVGHTPYGQASTQGVFAAVGILLMLIVGFLVPVRFYRPSLALNLAMLVVVALLVAVMFFGSVVNGNRNWLNVFGFSMQPSEFAKPVMILWLASVYSRQGRIDRGTTGQALYKALFPAILGFGLVVALILAGHDAGTVLIYVMFFGAIFMAARPSPSTVRIGIVALLIGALALVVTSPNRIERILNTFSFWSECQETTCDQANSGLAALATGGFWGVGLGQSRQKYNYLPEAHNDYIFAVIGEELGLVGAVALILLYAALIYCSMRILLRSSDLFIRYATIGIITWIAGQALLNISMVVGIMPVIGVPLPFISAGGSSLVSVLFGVGVLIAFARQTPLNPIVGERTGLVNAKKQKDDARRVALGRVVAREQIALAKDPDGAGWTLEKFLDRWKALVDGGKARPNGKSHNRSQGKASALGESQASVPRQQTRRPGQAPVPGGQKLATTAPRLNTGEPLRPQRTQQKPPASYQSGSVQASGSATRPPANAEGTTAPAPKPQHQVKQAPAEGSAHVQRLAPQERKVPQGLRTIRKARDLPNHKK
ncbi:FtsW/RodA/SpoVE family cell cycle protein [Rothia sp. CCM 9416]|uniref:FtsW/RodA/SpoVE family cell cycle protein n=1 Tax=Rothia sp. CCM 9416 TaxID=3402655 RepID=UPI003AEDE7D9